MYLDGTRTIDSARVDEGARRCTLLVGWRSDARNVADDFPVAVPSGKCRLRADISPSLAFLVRFALALTEICVGQAQVDALVIKAMEINAGLEGGLGPDESGSGIADWTWGSGDLILQVTQRRFGGDERRRCRRRRGEVRLINDGIAHVFRNECLKSKLADQIGQLEWPAAASR